MRQTHPPVSCLPANVWNIAVQSCLAHLSCTIPPQLYAREHSALRLAQKSPVFASLDPLAIFKTSHVPTDLPPHTWPGALKGFLRPPRSGENTEKATERRGKEYEIGQLMIKATLPLLPNPDQTVPNGS